METFAAALCSLARAGVEFVPCPSVSEELELPTAICFKYKNGFAALAVHYDIGFQEAEWFEFMSNPRLHVVLPNLRMWYNNNPTDNLRYRNGLTALVDMMRRASQLSPRKLVAFWGSSPQHFPSPTGSFSSPKNSACSPILREESTFRQNRWRDEVVRDIISNGTFPPNLFPGSLQYRFAEEAATEDTGAAGGIFHLETWHWLVHRADAHPGSRYMQAWPAMAYHRTADDPRNRGRTQGIDPCHYSTDCTHHCWSPLLAQTLWERTEMAVSFHYRNFQALPRL
jgi:hypothetical protein